MPGKASAPMSVETQPVETVDVDTIQVVMISIHMPHLSSENSLDVQYVGGLDDGNGNIDWKMDRKMTLTGVDFDNLAGGAASGATVYDVIKNAVYAKLIADGVLPADAVIS